jgi:hypothetical protein
MTYESRNLIHIFVFAATFDRDYGHQACPRPGLDALYARACGLTRKPPPYILDPREEGRDPLDPAGYAARAAASDFPSETFRVLKEKELAKFGEYRTRRLVLEAWSRLG